MLRNIMKPFEERVIEELKEIYPVFFVNDLPVNDFIAAANETLRMQDRSIMQNTLKSFFISKLHQFIEDKKKKILTQKKNIDKNRDTDERRYPIGFNISVV